MFLRLNKFNQHSPKSQPHENQVSILKNHNYIQLTDDNYVFISCTKIFTFLYNLIHVDYQYSRFTLSLLSLFLFRYQKGWILLQPINEGSVLLCFLLLLIQSNPRFSVWPFNEVYVWFFKNFLGGFIFWNAFQYSATTHSVWRRRFGCVAEIFAGKSSSLCYRRWRVSFLLDFL